MSKNEIYAVYDEASQAFVQFVPAINERIAKMNFEKMFKERRLNIPLLYDYPDTFKVYHLGSFDDNTGIFKNLPQQELLLDFGSLSLLTTQS